MALGLCVVGLAFSLSGAVGILRMPDLYTRIQCSSKNVTMGALPLLAGVVVSQGPISTYGSRALVVAFLLLVVNPMASHALGRAAYRTGIPMWAGSVVDQARPPDAGGKAAAAE
ncbi:MAG: monovalent cation/H(+) antiporter subunit G [Acidimicrobiales bacterium]